METSALEIWKFGPGQTGRPVWQEINVNSTSARRTGDRAGINFACIPLTARRSLFRFVDDESTW